MKKKQVLVVAHQLELRAKIAGVLQPAGYAVELAGDEKRALHLTAGGGIEAAIVVSRSGSVDLKLAQELHETVPKLIVLSDRADDIARLARSLPQAHAFLSQPLNEQEILRSLAQPISQRRENDETGRAILVIEGRGKVDLAGSTFVDLEGREVLLTRAECSILAAFGRNAGRVLSRDQLCHAAFGRGVEPYERSIDMHIARLRRKIEPDPNVPRFILTVPGAGYKFVARLQRDNAGSRGAATRPALALPDKPSIAVLAFENMSGDPKQDYFADGIVEDIISSLSRMPWLFVIARNSTFTYKGRPVDVKQVGRELGVGYVLEGSVRKCAHRVRLSGQLIDASTGAHLWADRFESALDDIFELQDQLTASVVCAIAPKLEQAEMARAARKPTENLNSYDYFLRGMASLHQWRREDVQEALQLFYRAIALDPKFASAHGAAAQCYANRKAHRWMTDRAQEIAEAERLASRAVALGRDDAFALSSSGNALAYVVGDLEGGLGCIERALALNPNLAAAWYHGAWVRIFLGEPDVAMEHLERAMRLSPFDSRLGLMETAMAFAYCFAGRYEEASSWAEKAIRDAPDFGIAAYICATSHALAGRSVVARSVMARIRQFDPARRISHLKEDIPLRRPEDYSRLAEGLRKAGLPE
jgi:TolB-like protein/DNA-binding response OmpR family regulator/Tfp pilus assembly protein PilF